jgi:hypothetical protein
MPTRVANAIGAPSREAFLEDYQTRTAAVRKTYTEVMARGGG